MAEDSLYSVYTNAILMSLLTLALASFLILLVNNEGYGHIFDNDSRLDSFNMNVKSYLANDTIDKMNLNINLTSEYDPELAISAADMTGNSMAINTEQIIATLWIQLALFGSIIFGNVWTTLISGFVLSLLTGWVAFLIVRFIRSGT